MNKTVNFSLAGQAFTGDEDAYQTLSAYLAAVSRTFYRYPSAAEILSDIEARAAELLAGRLRQSGRTVVHMTDVQTLMTTLGRPEDFADPALAMGGNEGTGDSYTSSGTPGVGGFGSPAGPRGPLVRLRQELTVGGVASGLAAYAHIDPVWIRAAFLSLLVGLSWLPPFTGTVLVAYIILWIVLPESGAAFPTLPRRLFRLSEGAVIGGVSAGLARTLNIDRSVMRIIFVALIFAGGLGIGIYIILWMSMRYPRTAGEHLQLDGRAPTLDGYEAQATGWAGTGGESGAAYGTGGESSGLGGRASQFTRTFGEGIGALARFVAIGVRVFIGVILTIVGLSFLVSSLVVGIALLNRTDPNTIPGISFRHENFPLADVLGQLSPSTLTIGTLAVVIPAILLFVLGLSAVMGRLIVRPLVLAVLSVVWIGVAIAGGVLTGGVLGHYSKEGTVVKQMSMPGVAPGDTVYLRLDTPADQMGTLGDASGVSTEEATHYYWPTLSFAALPGTGTGPTGAEALLTIRQQARGATETAARDNATQVSYMPRFEGRQADMPGHVVTLPEYFTRAQGETFRMQQVSLQARLPVGTVVILEGDRGPLGRVELANGSKPNPTEAILIGPGGAYQVSQSIAHHDDDGHIKVDIDDNDDDNSGDRVERVHVDIAPGRRETRTEIILGRPGRHGARPDTVSQMSVSIDSAGVRVTRRTIKLKY